MKRYLKRIVPLVCAVAIVLAGLVIPVEVSADAVDKSIVNLLPSNQYEFAAGFDAFKPETQPFKYFTNVPSAQWRWSVQYQDIGFVGFVLTVQVSNGIVPSSLRITPYAGAPSLTWTLVGQAGDYLQYKYDGSFSVYQVTLSALWSDNYSGRFNIVSFYGIVGDVVNVDSISYQVTRFTTTNGDTTRALITNVTTAAVPLRRSYESPTGNFNDVINVGVRNLKLPGKYLDSMSILIATYHPDCNITAYVGEDRVPSQWDKQVVYKTLAVDSSLSYTSRIYVEDGRYYNLYYYSVTVDLTGVDLTDKMINFCFDVYPVAAYEAVWDVLYITYKIPIEQIPWYQLFYNWIKKFFQSENQLLVSQIIDALGSGNDNMVNGTPEQNNQVSDDVGKLENGSSLLDDLTDQMQVDRPEISGSDVNISELVDPSSTQLLATPILAIWNSGTIVSILIFLAVVMLISFVFFGKKG